MKRKLVLGRLLTVPVLTASALAVSAQMTPAGAAGDCLPTPTLTVTHIAVTTVQNGPEFDGTADVTVESNGDGYDLTTTDQTGFVYDENGSQTSTHQGTVYDFGPPPIKPGDVRTYTLELHPFDSNSCYEANDGTQVVDKTLTVTYYAVGEGGSGSVDGNVVPGSNAETQIPGAPSPNIAGPSRVDQVDTCSATVPAHDSVRYSWFVAGTQVATGKSFTPQASDYGKALACGATGYNNAIKPGQVGKSDPVEVGLGAALSDVNGPPALDGETRSGGHLRVTHGFWTPKASSYKYQWYVGTKKIKGATSNKIVVPKSAIGKRLVAKVTAFADGYKDGHGSVKSLRIPF